MAAWRHRGHRGERRTLKAAGVSERAIGAVIALTRTDDIPADDYYATIAEHPVARLVKVADIASNLAPERTARLEPTTRDRLAAKYAHALQQLHVDQSVIDNLHVPTPDHA